MKISHIASICAIMVAASGTAVGQNTSSSSSMAGSGTASAQNTQKSGNTGSASAPKDGKTTQQSAASGATPDEQATGAVLMLVPLVQVYEAKTNNGCWARFYDGKNFTGSSITLVGPVDMKVMHPPANDWANFDSAVVGPKATVTTFDNENFKERTATLKPGASHTDLGDKKLGWFEEVKSARVTCS